MQAVKGPQHEGTYPDREHECQAALEQSLQQIAEQAISAGWSRQETAAALAILADNNVLAIAQNATADSVIAGRTQI